jgi:hypothetical protein
MPGGGLAKTGSGNYPAWQAKRPRWYSGLTWRRIGVPPTIIGGACRWLTGHRQNTDRYLPRLCNRVPGDEIGDDHP